MCGSGDTGCKCQKVKEALLDKVGQLENAAKRGSLLCDLNPDIPAEKTISAEQCNWTLKDCAMFRRFIDRIFG